MSNLGEEYGLPQRWAEYLRARAVTPEASRARGYRVVLSGKKEGGLAFASAYGFPRNAYGLLMPLHGVGNPEAVQLRLDRPEDLATPTRPAPKFLTPKGQANTVITSPLTRDFVQQGAQSVIIAEGVTRVDALAGYGIPALGLAGIWNWRGSRRNTTLALGDWDDVAIKGNRFVLAPDGDVAHNPKVNSAVVRLKRWLLSRGAAAVHVLALPDGHGLDDWLASNSFPDDAAVAAGMKGHYAPEHVEELPKVAQLHPTGDGIDPSDAGSFGKTPVADVGRLLSHAPTRLCVVRGSSGNPWRLLVEQTGGRWSSVMDTAQVGELHLESALVWQSRIAESAARGDIRSREALTCTTWALKAAKPEGLRDMLAMLGAAYLHYEARGKLPPGLSVCDESQIDSDRFVLGAPNGVIDLVTGQLMKPWDARLRFVTRSIPDDFDPDARHPYVDGLMQHLDVDDRRFLFEALGYALRCEAAKALYALVGPGDGGKSTLMATVTAALGDVLRGGYGMAASDQAFIQSRWSSGAQAHEALLVGADRARIVYSEELPDNGALNKRLLKAWVGGGSRGLRDVGAKRQAGAPFMSTLFFLLNTGQERMIDLTDSGMQNRWRLIPIPKMTDVTLEPELMRSMSESVEVRQAMVALLVKYAAATKSPPEMPPNVRRYTSRRRLDSIGMVGEWLESYLAFTGDPRHVTPVNTAMDALAAACGGWVSDGRNTESRVEGKTRREILALARELHPDLPRPKNTRRGYEWRGVRLTEDAEERSEDDGGLLGRAAAGGGELLRQPIDARLDANAAEDAAIRTSLSGGGADRYAQLEAAMIESARDDKPLRLPDSGPDLLRLARLESRRAALEGLRNGVKVAGAAGLSAAHIDALGGATAFLDRIEAAAEGMKPDQLRRLDWEATVIEARVLVQAAVENTRASLLDKLNGLVRAGGAALRREDAL